MRKWQSSGADFRRIGGNSRLISFAGAAKHVKVFEADWNQNGVRDVFLNRLIGSSTAEGVLFELQAGIHFLRQGFRVEYVGCNQTDSQRGDMVIHCASGRVSIECTCRLASVRRTLWDKKMASDLLDSASDKLESKTDYGHARLVAVKVPEYVHWDSSDLRSRLQQQINAWAIQGRLRSTNCIYFLGQEAPRFIRTQRPGSSGYWSLSPTVFLFRNDIDYRYNLPLEVAAALRMSE